MSVDPEKAGVIKKMMHHNAKRNSKASRVDKLPKVLMQPNYAISRTTKRASEKLHTTLLVDYKSEGL